MNYKAIISDRPNKKWARHHTEGLFSIKKIPILSTSSRVFTIGSCFAEEVRIALSAAGIETLPNYKEITLSQRRAVVDTLPDREHMNFYNTFSILQEFQRAAGLWTQDEGDFWTTKDTLWGQGEMFQDPYRRECFGRTVQDLRLAQDQINTQFRIGFEEADVFFITLGLIEVWKKKNNGKIANQRPNYLQGGGADETEFHLSSYEENYQNLRDTLALIFEAKPDARVCITVSPVPMARTFTSSDVYTANMESKSVLRAVASATVREFDNAVYFPSYEVFTLYGKAGYQGDGRHVEPTVVQAIMAAFRGAHFEP